MKNWQLVARCSVGVSFGLCLLLGIAGYLAFLESTQGDILNNFPATGVAVNAARALLAFTMLFTYPLECYVTRHCLMSIIDRWMMMKLDVERDGASTGISLPVRHEGSMEHSMQHSMERSAAGGPVPSVAGQYGRFVGVVGCAQRGGVHRIQDETALEMSTISLSRPPGTSTDSPLCTAGAVASGDVNTVKEGGNHTSQFPVKSDRAQTNIPVKPDWLQSNIPLKSDRAQSNIPVKPAWPQSNSMMRSDSVDSAEGGRDWTDPPSVLSGDDEEDGVAGVINTRGVSARNRNGVINSNGAINGHGRQPRDSKWTWGMGQRMFSRRWSMIKDDDPPVDNYIPQGESSSQHPSQQLSSRMSSSSSSQQLPQLSSLPPSPPSSPPSSPPPSSSQSFTRRTTLTLLIWGTTVGLALAFDDLGNLTRLRLVLLIHLLSLPPKLPFQSILANLLLNPPSQPTLSTQPINPPSNSPSYLAQVWYCP